MAERTRTLPSLDLLKGFESAARHLNFTKAADELFLTQSAVSRQIQALEERLGLKLFVRQRRGLQLTQQGDRLFRAVQEALRLVQETVDTLSPRTEARRVTVTSTMAFCSLWLIPRLGDFHRIAPDVDVRIAAHDKVLNLDRERIDVSVRYCPAHIAPAGAIWLFDEEVLPVCSASLVERTGKPLERPVDLAHHVLLHLDDPDNPTPWLSWTNWLAKVGCAQLKPVRSLAFNYSEQVVRAALAGQGVALGRLPLVRDLLHDGSLVAPFAVRASTDRAYWLVRAGFSEAREEVDRLVAWIMSTAARPTESAADATAQAAGPTKRRTQREMRKTRVR
jgi:DNA-binding transcriptional LysR family regulator